jgi:hypothetical protein
MVLWLGKRHLMIVKASLVGQGYSLRSVTAAAQACINLYPELLQDPNEQAKNKAFLYGIPGRHVFKDLTTIDAAATPVRGIFTGAGRCFVAAGTKYFEIDSSGNLVGSVHTISNATVFGFANSPVQFFPNGNELFIVSGGVPYVDDGSGPVVVNQGDSTGVVNAFGTGVGWVSGDQFVSDGSWVGKTININGTNYTIGNSPAPPTMTQLYTTSAISVTSPPSYSYTVAGAQFPYAAVTGAFLDNSFWFNLPFSRIVKFSNVNNGDVWNGLDFITKDSWPDNVRSILACGSQIYLFGDESFEVWTANPNSATDPFTRIDGASGRIGSVSAWGPIAIEGNVYFLGSGSAGQVIAYVLNGFTPTRISQHGQEAIWYANHLGPGAISYSYNEEGHTFWVINFGAQTWAFDTTTGAWHQRMGGPFSGFTPYGTAYHSYIPEFGNGKHLTGGPLDGKIYESSVAFYDDAGSNIDWQRSIAFLYNARNRMYDRRLELEMETGTTPSGTPVITMDMSDDRGHTFANPQTASIGSSGQYSQRVYWMALGSYYERVYRLSGSSQGRVALVDLELDQEKGDD